MSDGKTNKINWRELDQGWEERYREDYGHMFDNKAIITEYP